LIDNEQRRVSIPAFVCFAISLSPIVISSAGRNLMRQSPMSFRPSPCHFERSEKSQFLGLCPHRPKSQRDDYEWSVGTQTTDVERSEKSDEAEPIVISPLPLSFRFLPVISPLTLSFRFLLLSFRPSPRHFDSSNSSVCVLTDRNHNEMITSGLWGHRPRTSDSSSRHFDSSPIISPLPASFRFLLLSFRFLPRHFAPPPVISTIGEI